MKFHVRINFGLIWFLNERINTYKQWYHRCRYWLLSIPWSTEYNIRLKLRFSVKVSAPSNEYFKFQWCKTFMKTKQLCNVTKPFHDENLNRTEEYWTNEYVKRIHWHLVFNLIFEMSFIVTTGIVSFSRFFVLYSSVLLFFYRHKIYI